MQDESRTTLIPGLRRLKGQSLLLSVEELRKEFRKRRRLLGRSEREQVIHAVDGVSFDVARGETFGLVGESGSGKTTVARCLLRLTEPTDGRIVFDGTEMGTYQRHELRRVRRRIQMVSQDALGSLDPRWTVRALVEEPLVIHGKGGREERRQRVDEIMRLVGIRSHELDRRPHAFSGGQRQRIAMARSLILQPELIVLDEPVSALDVSVQAQVLNLVQDLQEEFGLTYVFIVHDLALARYLCDRLAVLYLGQVMEIGPVERILGDPMHPYTVSLLTAVPVPDPEVKRQRLPTVIRDNGGPSKSSEEGCPYRHQCSVGRNREICAVEKPVLVEQESGHWVACHFPGEASGEGSHDWVAKDSLGA